METSQRNLFFYWTGQDFDLIKKLRDLIFLHSNNATNFKPHFITKNNARNYLDDIPDEVWKTHPAFQADYIRVHLINKFGGIWVDSDTLIMSDLDQLFTTLEKNHGFFITENRERLCNGVFGSIPQTALMKNWCNFTKSLITSKNKIQWGTLGNHFLTKTYLHQRELFEKYILFDGLSSMYPVNWDIADKIYCSPENRISTVHKEFQPLIILVNSVYKTWESNQIIRENSLMNDLLITSKLIANSKSK